MGTYILIANNPVMHLMASVILYSNKAFFLKYDETSTADTELCVNKLEIDCDRLVQIHMLAFVFIAISRLEDFWK
jgi:hypothetical protein